MDHVGKTPTLDQLSRLQRNCTTALAKYFDEAQKTCELLGKIGTFPLPLELRQAILKQRQAEFAANEQYQQSKERLFDAAKCQG